MQFLYLLLVSPILTWAPYGKIFLTVPSKSVPSLRFNISCKILWQLRSSFKKQWKKKRCKTTCKQIPCNKRAWIKWNSVQNWPKLPFRSIPSHSWLRLFEWSAHTSGFPPTPTNMICNEHTYNKTSSIM